VQDGLLPFGAPFAKFHHSFCKAIGEDYWATRHDQDPADRVFDDNLQDSEFRCVIIGLTPAPVIPAKPRADVGIRLGAHGNGRVPLGTERQCALGP